MRSEHEAVLHAAYHANLEVNAFARAWGRTSPRNWLVSLGREETMRQLIEAFPDEVLSREALRNRLRDETNPKVSALLVLAWGEMRVRNARLLFDPDVPQPLLDLVARLRASEMTREDAYSAFRELQDSNSIPGLGPAYYTKLIYFLRDINADETGAGFIMDQWTATSINLLFGDKIVKMDKDRLGKKYYVSKRNTAKNYERFCGLIEDVAKHWGARAEHVEITLFGGGKGHDAWREHVIASLRALREAVPEDEADDAP